MRKRILNKQNIQIPFQVTIHQAASTIWINIFAIREEEVLNNVKNDRIFTSQ